jgi:hypothetical protein
VRSILKTFDYQEAKWRLRKLSNSEDTASEIKRIEDLIVNDFDLFKEVEEVEEIEEVNSEKLFLGDNSVEFSRSRIDEIALIQRILDTRGRLRWLCFRFINEIFNDAYEISRGQLMFRLVMNRNRFRESVLNKLRILIEKPEQSQSISVYEYTHPDTRFVFEKNHFYFLEDNLNAPLIFKKKNSNSISSRKFSPHSLKNIISRKFTNSNFRKKNSLCLLERIIYWDSSKVLLLMQLSPTIVKVPQIQSFLSRYPDLIAQYNSLERFPVVFHEYSARTLDEREDLLNPGPDVLINVKIWHQRFIIQDKKWVVTDVTGSPYTKFVAGHWQFLEQNKNEGVDVFIKKPSATAITKLKAAIYLMGRADENWYHLLLDTLPRYLFLKHIDLKVPVLVRSDLPKTSLQFLSKILRREVIFVKPDEVFSIDKLFLIASRSTVFDSKPPSNLEKVKFPRGIYQDLQSYIFEELPKKRLSGYPKKLYLPRKSKYRSLLNEMRVSNLASNLGFSIIESNVDFYRRQYYLFNQAQTVLSPGGAVLANTIFMQPGSRVLLIRSWRDSDLLLWKKLAEVCDVDFDEAIGIPTYYGRNALSRQHSNFYLPLRRARKLLKSRG